MYISFNSSKECQWYKDYLEHPENRAYQKKFKQHYSQELMGCASKLHNRLVLCENILSYNSIYGGDKNKIEEYKGKKQNDYCVLKVRVTDNYRKYLSPLCPDNLENCISVKDWKGQYNQISHIHILRIDKHKYNL